MISTLIVHDPEVSKAIIRDRRRKGHDRHDEVWDGVYIIMPQPNNEHYRIAGALLVAFHSAIDPSRLLMALPGGNVSDRTEKWTKNYRCPDVLVFLAETSAQDRESYWLGGPDFAVEILSPRDRAREKLGFYAEVGVRELLLIDREPWRLELYRLVDGALAHAGSCGLDGSEPIRSDVLDLSFGLKVGESHPQIVVTRPTDGSTWLA